jgi:CheY-like chemotaxis protein
MASPVSNHIILADDDRDHGILFYHILKQVDFSKDLTIIHDGESLMLKLQQFVPEVLFLDLKMPCKHGLECLKEIRNSSELKDLKVVVYSSSAQMSDIQKSYCKYP